ncbi:MAG: DUF4160 domain-containing protein [Acetobacteraceae bacterium]|nr:DUF4160 domain-containing protein [Acetobacteraceae bacterium]
MPTVLRHAGWRVAIYPNDHPPAHVHVIGPGWVVVVNLLGAAGEPAVREVIGDCNEPAARRVLRLVAGHRTALLEAWRRYHG